MKTVKVRKNNVKGKENNKQLRDLQSLPSSKGRLCLKTKKNKNKVEKEMDEWRQMRV